MEAVLADGMRLVGSERDIECHFGVQLLGVLLETKQFHGHVDCGRVWKCCCKRSTEIYVDAVNVILGFCEREGFVLEYEEVIDDLARRGDKEPCCRVLIGRAVAVFKQKLGVPKVMGIILDGLHKWRCGDGNYCVFELVEEAFRIFGADFDVGKIDVDVPCKHYVNCVALDQSFATEKVAEFFNHAISVDDPGALIDALRMHKIMPDRIVLPFKNIPRHYGSVLLENTDYELHCAIAELMAELQEVDKGAATCLMSLSLFDPEKRMRKKALDLMKPCPFYAGQKLVCNWLVDSSFGVRKRGIKMIACLADYNPLEMRPQVLEYLQRVFSELVRSPDIMQCCKYASFLATVTKFCHECTRLCLSTIVSVALKIIKHTLPDSSRLVASSVSDSNTVSSSAFVHTPRSSDTQDDVCSSAPVGGSATSRSVSPVSESSTASIARTMSDCDFALHQRPVSDGSATLNSSATKYSLDTSSFSDIFLDKDDLDKSPNRSKVLITLIGKYVDKRDAHLVKTIANLGAMCEPYMGEILDMFNHLFRQRQNRKLLLTSVKALTKLSLSVCNGLNIRLRCPQIAVPLVSLMTKTHDDKLLLAIVKLFGSAFDTIDIIQTQSFAAANERNIVSEDKLFTSLVLTCLLDNLGEPSLTEIKTLTIICQSDPTGSAAFLPDIVDIFQSFIEKGSPKVREQSFSYLLILVKKLRVEMAPLLPKLLPTLMENLTMISCATLCKCISIIMKNDFIECANSMYYPCLKLLWQTKDMEYFREMLFFAGSMVIHQYQSLEDFIGLVDRRNVDREWVPILVDALTYVTQNVDVQIFISRLVTFILRTTKAYPEVDVSDLLVSMGLRGFPSVHVLFLLNSIDKDNPQRTVFERILSSGVPTPEDVKVIRDYTPELPCVQVAPKHEPTEVFFMDLGYPLEAKMSSWISDLRRIVITRSPSSSIRACSEYLKVRSKVIHGIVRTAFVTCWRNASCEDRDHFSEIVNRIIHEHKRVHQLVTDFIQLAFRTLLPMNIDIMKLAELSELRQFTMYVLQEKLIMNPNDKSLLKPYECDTATWPSFDVACHPQYDEILSING